MRPVVSITQMENAMKNVWHVMSSGADGDKVLKTFNWEGDASYWIYCEAGGDDEEPNMELFFDRSENWSAISFDGMLVLSVVPGTVG